MLFESATVQTKALPKVHLFAPHGFNLYGDQPRCAVCGELKDSPQHREMALGEELDAVGDRIEAAERAKYELEWHRIFGGAR